MVFAFLFVGIFFVGCNVDYSKIEIVPNQAEINLLVGESVDVCFKIENYQSGFSNKVKVNPRSDGSTAVFETSEPVYISKNEIKIKVTGVAGGSGEMYVTTLEAGKECSVTVNVTQYTSSMDYDNSILYVSNKTDFVPNEHMFVFDLNTTYKELSYYYLSNPSDIDFNIYALDKVDLQTNKAIFSDGVSSEEESLDIQKFDCVKLEKAENGENTLILNNDNESIHIDDLTSEFLFLAVYDYSLNNDDYDSIIYDIATVYVLPDLEIEITGGYMKDGKVDFKEDSYDNDAVDNIVIVPNNPEMLQYVLKIQMNNYIENSPIKINKFQENDYLDVDFFEYEEDNVEGKTIYYLKISQNSQTQKNTMFTFEVYYDIAQGIEDESVNKTKSFNAEIQIAPNSILVNGTSEPDPIVMYNYYKYPEFGWNELMIDVISGYSSLPNFEGVYFEFADYENFVDIVYDGVTVKSGDAKLYTDLSKSFYIRGKLGAEEKTDIEIYVCVKSSIMENGKELKIPIPCSIIAGATVVMEVEGHDTYYLDISAGEQDFSQQVYADQKFQFATYKFLNGLNVVDIEIDDENPYLENGKRFYLNLKVVPKMLGVGIYRIYLDNGMPIELTFSVIKTLSQDSTSIQLTNFGNESVIQAEYSRSEESEFDDILNIEILNPSNSENIQFGNVAQVSITANVGTDGIKPPATSKGGIVSIAKIEDYYRISTLENGDVKITFTLSGLKINNFETRKEEINVYVNVSSYSLVNEFYLKNGENYALNNTVYYTREENQTLQEKDISVSLTSIVQNTQSKNFFRYYFVDEVFEDVFENAIPAKGNIYRYDITNENISNELVYDNYDQKFIYFYSKIIFKNSSTIQSTSTKVEITKVDKDNKKDTKTVSLTLTNGLMFLSKDIEYVSKDENGDILATYYVEFSNVYSIAEYGDFDMENSTYKNVYQGGYTLSISANLRQRNLTKKYDVKIVATQYQSVENISLATSLTQLNFSNNDLVYNVSVYTYPTNATNKNIRVEFVKTENNPYSDMVTWEIKTVEKDSGVYTVNLSCEKFYNNNRDGIVEIEESLTGKIYIYPSEWGDSYTSINGSLQPICIDVHYRNGSKANPYLIETAEDIVEINANETTLKSHYEISTVIDMSTVKDFTPIGILNGEVKGFSGSIIGTNSQSAISNIIISGTNFVSATNLKQYAGLFAQINEEAEIENITFSGKFDLSLGNDAYVGLLTSINKGSLTNVEIKIDRSELEYVANGKNLFFGAVAGVNYGSIVQDFRKYASGGANAGQNSKILAYYNDFVEIKTNYTSVRAGGIAGVSYGKVERISSSELKLYGYSSYSAYTLINVIGKNYTSNDLNVGGAVGAVVVLNEAVSQVKNLLIGGEVDTSEVVGGVDSVGGIAGYVDTYGKAQIDILENISRVFLRANRYVGGIVGYEKYEPTYDAGKIVNYLSSDETNKNIIEAVDDGRNNIFSAMMIRYSTLTENEEKKIEDGKNIFYAVGNSLENKKDYSKSPFDNYSYLKRDPLNKPDSDKEVLTNSVSNTDYYGDYLIVTDKKNGSYTIHNIYNFVSKEVDLNLDETKDEYKMKENGESDVGVYFMYYFAVQSRIIGENNGSAQDEIEDLNFITPNSEFYPFVLNSQDITISSSSSNILTVDINGNLIVKGTGLAMITLTSILNVVKSRVLYVYIVNYFDKNVSSSIFYTTPNLNGVNITNESVVKIYGNSSTNIYVVPSYDLEKSTTYNSNTFIVSSDGVLSYKNVSYLLYKNTQVSVDKAEELDADDYFSTVQINKQTIIFYKNKKNVSEDDEDNYKLVPMLQIEIQIDNKRCVFYYELTKTAINLSISYKETATSIRTKYKYHSMKTNNEFTDVVTVDSTNDKELLFYQIVKRDGDKESICQSRLPNYIGEVDEDNWSNYINYDGKYSSEERLFDINFKRRYGETNVFDYTCRINTSSSKFLNRFDEDIFGEYIVRLYASELENGVSYSFVIILDEAEINYVSIENFSNIKDISVADSILVPSQRGILEVSLDPVEAVFDKFTITNNQCNYQTGATEASLTFVYEKITQTGVEYVQASNFGRYLNGTYSFTYKEMLEYFEQLNDEFVEENASVDYVGKIYLSYYMPSKNVDDGVTVGFDVNVTYGNAGKDSMPATILLTTKLGSYAKLSFATKSNYGDVYYVARGLSYDMVLDYYGFEEEQINISSSNSFIANIVADNGSYKLKITSESINYSGNEDGYKIEIKTVASKVVDNVSITTIDTITLYVMEYVMNYVYIEGQNEDIVNGMEDGIIYNAIGNPYSLEFSIRKFLEYDKTNLTVNKEVDYFVEEMTKNIEWKVYFDDTETVLEDNKTIKTNYYSIKSYTVTPLKIYNAESDIYHFSASGYYKMDKGVYKHSESIFDAEMIYTEFSFKVHQQSTEDSPIPVETYQELIEMKDNEWYILLKDITIPSKDLNSTENDSDFSPITTKIAGLDGNGHKIKFAGTYEFSNISNIGLFGSLTQNAILKNVTLYLTQSVVFKTDVSTYNIGVLVGENAGIITNCSIESADGVTLSVVCSATASSSYVAGLVANNSGTITNSRSSVNLLSNSNLAGVVGKNSGKIASSYYLGASLKNETNTTSEFTAGFAVENTGSIYTSYVSGKAEVDTMYYNKADNTIQSSNNITGFVYSNSGEVFDCYSNIQLKQSGAFASGFVFENSGEIGRCFSTSVLESKQTSNYGFARINSISGTKGTISDCYYLEDEDVNISIGKIDDDGIEPLTMIQFGEIDEYFSSYVVANGRDINSVWFFNENDKSDRANFNGAIFNIGRIELVAPNIIAESKRELDSVENIVDEDTGASYSKYNYVFVSDSEALGSVYNPILIDCAENMENYILQENNAGGYNYSYYRLISDIDYSDYMFNSKLYTTKFMGYIEGNFMDIKDISLISSSIMSSAGMFAEIGSSKATNAIGTVMNISISPLVVSFANTNLVGALAGKVDNGNVFNINAIRTATDQVVVVGKNIAGGVIGLATGEYDFKNIYSQFSAKARNQDFSVSNNFNSKQDSYDNYSFAGSNIAVLSGSGKVYNTVVDEGVSVLAGKAGLAFGYIDSNVSVTKVVVDMSDDMLINAYSYGGLVVGESRGVVSNVIVNGTDYFENFKKIPHLPTAVGGFAGLISGGVIDNVTINQSIRTSSQSSNSGISALGGLAGVISNSADISNITINASLIGYSLVGGVAGKISADSKIVYFKNIDVSDVLLSVCGHKMTGIGIGGLTGFIDNGSVISLKTSQTGSQKLKDLENEVTELEEAIQELETEINASEIDDKTLLEKEQKLATKKKELAKMQDSIEKNRFVISISICAYIYGVDLSISAGAIVGTDESLVAHLVYYTESSITTSGDCAVYDMSQSYSNATEEVYVGEDLSVKATHENALIKTRQLTAIKSKFYCNVKFTTVDSEQYPDSSLQLILILYGEGVLF